MTEPTELFYKDGSPANAFGCGTCGKIYPTNRGARWCCGEHPCTKCNENMVKGWSELCHACRAAAWTRQERERWKAAPKTPAREHQGPIWVENFDRYFSTYADLVEWVEDQPEAPEELRAYGCQIHHLHLDGAHFIEHATDDMHEEAAMEISESSMKELQAYLDQWAAAQSVTSWFPDHNVGLDASDLLIRGEAVADAPAL